MKRVANALEGQPFDINTVVRQRLCGRPPLILADDAVEIAVRQQNRRL